MTKFHQYLNDRSHFGHWVIFSLGNCLVIVAWSLVILDRCFWRWWVWWGKSRVVDVYKVTWVINLGSFGQGLRYTACAVIYFIGEHMALELGGLYSGPRPGEFRVPHKGDDPSERKSHHWAGVATSAVLFPAQFKGCGFGPRDPVELPSSPQELKEMRGVTFRVEANIIAAQVLLIDVMGTPDHVLLAEKDPTFPGFTKFWEATLWRARPTNQRFYGAVSLDEELTPQHPGVQRFVQYAPDMLFASLSK